MHSMMSSYQPKLSKAPTELIQANDQPAFGLFDGSVAHFNLQNFVYHNLMDKKANALARYFHYKQFQFICITGPDWLLAVAIADIRYANSAYFHAWRSLNNIQADQLITSMPITQ